MLHTHDCKYCIYLGSDNNLNIDAYLCKGRVSILDTIIARFSSYPSNYFSTHVDMLKNFTSSTTDYGIALRKAGELYQANLTFIKLANQALDEQSSDYIPIKPSIQVLAGWLDFPNNPYNLVRCFYDNPNQEIVLHFETNQQDIVVISFPCPLADSAKYLSGYLG